MKLSEKELESKSFQNLIRHFAFELFLVHQGRESMKKLLPRGVRRKLWKNGVFKVERKRRITRFRLSPDILKIVEDEIQQINLRNLVAFYSEELRMLMDGVSALKVFTPKERWHLRKHGVFRLLKRGGRPRWDISPEARRILQDLNRMKGGDV